MAELSVPSQVGIGERGGAEALIRAVNVLADEHADDPERVLLKVDFSNAFNRISRQAFLEEVRLEYPEMARWTWWTYGGAGHLWAGGERITLSTSGTQQGDPLGPLLFSLLLRKVTRALQMKCPNLDLNSWYLDDGTLIGKRAQVVEALEYLCGPEVQALGLHINLSKCELWWPSGDAGFLEFPPGIKRAPPDGTEILKVPVGCETFTLSSLQRRIDQANEILAKLPQLEDKHVEFTLLRACLGACKLVYFLRGVPPSAGVSEVLRKADDALRLALERMLGRSVGDEAWCQAGLRTSTGGAGIRHSADVSHTAFVGSVLDSAPLVLKLLGRDAVSIPHLRRVASEFAAVIGPGADMEVCLALGRLERDDVTAEASTYLGRRPQRALHDTIEAKRLSDLICASPANTKDRLEAVGRDHAGAWLATFPSKNLGLWMQCSEFTVAVRLWLGMVDRCERKILLQPGAGMHGCHNALRDVLDEAARSAGLRPLKEVMVDSSGRRPADVYFPEWSRGAPLAIDVTVCNPSQITTTLAARDGFSASELAPEAKEKSKNSLNAGQCNVRGVTFTPIAICCYGGRLPQAMEVVKELALRSAASSGISHGMTCGHLWQKLPIALWRGNARASLRGCPWRLSGLRLRMLLHQPSAGPRSKVYTCLSDRLHA